MWRLFLAFAAAFLALASTASADPPDGQKPVAIPDRPSLGLFLGRADNGAWESGGGIGGEIDVAFDTPITRSHRVRFDATRSSWSGSADDGHGNTLTADTITLTSMRVSLVSVRHDSPHVASYGAIGVGAYRYDFARTPVTHHWHGGVSYIFGLEFLRHGERSAVNAEVRIHAMGGPAVQPAMQSVMFKVDAAVGMKVRF